MNLHGAHRPRTRAFPHSGTLDRSPRALSTMMDRILQSFYLSAWLRPAAEGTGLLLLWLVPCRGRLAFGSKERSHQRAGRSGPEERCESLDQEPEVALGQFLHIFHVPQRHTSGIPACRSMFCECEHTRVMTCLRLQPSPDRDAAEHHHFSHSQGVVASFFRASN